MRAILVLLGSIVVVLFVYVCILGDEVQQQELVIQLQQKLNKTSNITLQAQVDLQELEIKMLTQVIQLHATTLTENCKSIYLIRDILDKQYYIDKNLANQKH